MTHAVRSTITITLFTLGGFAFSFANQIVVAAMFGTSSEMDAFLAAYTLPQYLTMILMSSLGAVFIPVFIDFKTREKALPAYKFASHVFNNVLLILGVISLLGIIFAKPLLRLTTPGLGEETLELANRAAIILWPSVVASGALTLLASLYQAENRFGWQAAVPLIGAAVNLALVVLVAPWYGGVGLAIAFTVSTVTQTILLLRILLVKERYAFSLNWKHPGVQQVFRLLLPLFLLGLMGKFTPLIDRYLASGFETGRISQLNYAFKIIIVLAGLISGGIATVIFPRMALNVSNDDIPAMKETMAKGLRIMWFAVAPIVIIGCVIAPPLVAVAFERGQFTPDDTSAVAGFIQLYLFSLVGSSLGAITGKCFYVLRDTRTLALFGAVEAVCYAVYTVLLTRWLGVIGIVLGYVLYFTISFTWQGLILRHRTGPFGGKSFFRSIKKTLFAAMVSGSASFFVVVMSPSPHTKLLFGWTIGLFVYLAISRLIKSEEYGIMKGVLESFFRKSLAESAS